MKKIRNIILIAIILMAGTINTSCYAKIENEIKVDTSTQVSASHGGGGRSRATNTTNTTASDLIINPDNYKPTEVKGEDLGTGKSKAEKLIGIITTIGIIVSISSVMILGIKYMVGSIEERAEYKKTMLPVLIGMILLFGTSTILNIINAVING